MASQTTNLENRVEDITRKKIYQSNYWKEHCFGLNAETLVDKAVEISYIGGTYGGNKKPTPFMCLILKMLQIRPEKEIVLEFIRNTEYKYVRILGAFYLRLTGRAVDIYTYLELLYSDYRKLKLIKNDGSFVLIHVDEVVDNLLTMNFYFDIALPAIQNRRILMLKGLLDARKSILEDDFEDDDELKKEKMNEQIRKGDSCRSSDGCEKKSKADDHRDYKEYYDARRGRADDHRYYKEYCDERRGRGRDRNLKRSYSRSPSRSSRHAKRHQRHGCSRTSSKCERKKKAEKNMDNGMGMNVEHPNPEIAASNRLRASVGLKPLKF